MSCARRVGGVRELIVVAVLITAHKACGTNCTWLPAVPPSPLLCFPSLLLLLLLLLPLLFLLVVNIVAALLCFVAADLNLLAYAVCRCSKTKRDRERESGRGEDIE